MKDRCSQPKLLLNKQKILSVQWRRRKFAKGEAKTSEEDAN